MLTILASILVFGVLVTVHELGHFLTAKLTGMRVDEFAIGFGPLIYQTKHGDTTYSLRCIPLGGYNKIAGMEPGEEEVENGFSSKPILSRMLVILAGSIMNILLPIFLFFLIFVTTGLEQPSKEPIIGTIMTGQAASRAGLMTGDKILAINGEKTEDWTSVVTKLRAAGTQEVALQVERGNKVTEYKMAAEFNKEAQRPLIGVSPKFVQERVGVVTAGKMSLTYTKEIVKTMVRGLSRIITGKDPAEVAGPIGVAQMAGNIAEKGLMPLLSFMALLSINLAVFNLLPVPALDGGHFVVLLVEGIRGKPLAPRYMNAIHMIGLGLILALAVFSTMKDISRL